MRAELETQLLALGWSLEKFGAGDIRRVEGDGSASHWYIARNGMMAQKFQTLPEVAEWADGMLEGQRATRVRPFQRISL
jgi:hypothetical protein